MTSEGFIPSYETGTEWLRSAGASSDVVMSSRVRLARNLAGWRFGHKAGHGDRQKVLEICRDRIAAAGLSSVGAPASPAPTAPSTPPQVMWIDLRESPPIERQLLVERHLISKQHSKGKPLPDLKAGDVETTDPRGVAIALPDERLSIMVNEEDHLRIQAVRGGLALAEAWADADRADDLLESRLDFAYSPRFGYLTCCPTNVGTGVRMSLMLHLPGLKLTGEIEKVKRAAGDMNLAVRGFYGEGSEAAGDFYQISNQTTLGKGEQSILNDLAGEIIPKIVEYERLARRNLLAKRGAALEDQVYRALGLLTHARLLTAEESMQMLSHVRLGVVMGLVSDADLASVNALMLLTQPAHLQRVMGTELDQEQRRNARAQLIRRRLLKTG
ncbi:MAG: protein arginine kinase [Phycisphaerales bacterium]|jgi:protein arginine kinase|nr:protein arginine kinase [Phycisphaerales bacterium]